MKVIVVFNINGEVIGVTTDFLTAEKIFEEKSKSTLEFNNYNEHIVEYELDLSNNSEIFKIFLNYLTPKIEDFIREKDCYEETFYGYDKEYAIKYFEEFFEFMGIEKSFQDIKPISENRIRRKVKLQEELDNF